MPRNEKVKKEVQVWIPLLVGIAAAIGLLAGYNMNFANNSISLLDISEKGSPKVKDGRIEEILRFVETNYVDSLDQNKITLDAINHILEQLDPHSSYITPEELDDHNEKMAGQYKGVGIETVRLRDTFHVRRVMPGSPAEEAGLECGDAILSIEDKPMVGESIEIEDLLTYFNGTSGLDPLDLECVGIDGQVKKITNLIPDNIEIPSANEAYKLDSSTVYVRLRRFSNNTYKQFLSSIEKVIDVNQQFDLIIDLRENRGGYLPQAINILSQLFSEKGNMLTYTEGLNRKKSDYRTTGKPFFLVGKVVVLTNKNSASGSEIMAGAIQDWDRGIVIGQPTYGKGLVQQVFPLSNGGALRLTIAKYYTPSGRLIQKSYDNISKDFEADTSEYQTKILKRSVDGGGGVVPDYLVDDDYTFYCEDYDYYIDLHLLDLMKKSKQEYLSNSEFSVDAFQAFIRKEIEEEDVTIDDICRNGMLARMEARMARMQKGELEYRKLIHKDDPYILKALNLISDEKSTLALLSEK